MTDLLEQMKTRAEQAQTAYEAYKAECEKAQELPEVWYLHTDGDCGVSYSAGSASTCDNWCETLTGVTNHSRGYADSSSYFRKVTAAEYNNARALYHGADFTGRLHEIDRPVCELNKATREEMWGLPFNSFHECHSSEGGTFGRVMEEYPHWMNDTHRLRAPKKRPMTRKEKMIFAGVYKVCRIADNLGLVFPLASMDAEDADTAEWASIYTLNDDLTGGEWEAFEVQT